MIEQMTLVKPSKFSPGIKEMNYFCDVLESQICSCIFVLLSLRMRAALRDERRKSCLSKNINSKVVDKG